MLVLKDVHTYYGNIHALKGISLNVEKGEIVNCPDCGADLEVVGTDPVELELAPEEEEDWGE